ncbi:E3 ubiquitin-protein ligase MIB2-like, partial [Octopus sinensis]|uniref:E3 ubiquitin-protein ligase MIB2-like n=1 Tax=Octopus sinensis TaxID=2607531 RepID=A0A7E6EIL5_9MOLL
QRYDVVAFLLSQPDVEVNTKNIKETTPLFDAVSLSHFGILQKLVSHGAELDALDADGNNCLHLAVKKDKFHSEEETGEHLDYFWKRLGLEKEEKLCGTVIACYLGRSKANFHQKNNSGKTPVDLIESDYQEKIKELFPPFCLLCGVKEVSVTLLPCGDKVICRKCYEENQPRDCPKCEKPIKNFTVPATPKAEDKEEKQVAHSARKIADGSNRFYKLEKMTDLIRNQMQQFHNTANNSRLHNRLAFSWKWNY